MQEPAATNIEKRSISEQVFVIIKRMILSGEIRVGERIPEEKISKQFGVSRTPIREALKKLENYGLIKIKPRSYAQVVKIDDKEMDMIAAVRANIECFGVRITANRCKSLGSETIQSLIASMEECEKSLLTEDMFNIFEKDSLFHLELALCSGNHYIHEILEKLDAKIQLYRLGKCVTYEKQKRAVMQHRKIISAVLEGNASEADRLMYEHIYNNH